MKVFLGLLLAVAIGSTVALPARDPNSDAEYVTVRPDFKNFDGVIDTGAGDEYLPEPSNPFSGFGSSSDGFFTNIYDVMRRFRERVFGNWWNNVPSFDIDQLDPSQGNSTSEVKVVDGHRIEINDTVYTKTDDNGNALFKVRIINVRPVDEEGNPSLPDSTDTADTDNDVVTKTTQKSTEIKDREPFDNEVDSFGTSESTATTKQDDSDDSPTTTQSSFEFDDRKQSDEAATSSQSDDFDKILTTTLESSEFGDYVSTETIGQSTTRKSDEEFEKMEELVEQQQLGPQKEALHGAKPSQVSHESLIDNNAPRRLSTQDTEWSEEVDDDERQSGPVGSEWESFENDWHTNREDNSIDDVHRLPIDLTNDIEVNNMLADQGAPTNPDAEVFSVPSAPEQYRPPVFNPARPPVFDPVRPPFGWYPYQPNQFWPKRK